MNESLGNVLSNLTVLIDKIKDNCGEIPEDFDQYISVLTRKVDAVGFSIAMKNSFIDGLKQLKNSIGDEIKTEQNALNRYKYYLAGLVHNYGLEEETKAGKAKWLRGQIVAMKDTTKDEVIVENENEINDRFRIVTIELPLNYVNQLCLNVDNFEDNVNKSKQSINEKSLNDEYERTGEVPKGCKVVTKKRMTVYGLTKLEVKPTEIEPKEMLSLE